MALLKHYSEKFRKARELAEADAEGLLDALICETDEAAIADLLIAWNDKGIVENEIYEFARILRSRMIRVNSHHETYVDIVGTGGSSVKTFNVSTAAAFVVAGAGLPVAKHGNKAATSKSGSADVLVELGIDPAVDPQAAERNLNGIGISFMYAPHHHRLSPTLAKVRRGLGFPTIFNCVGPLCNPASAPRQLIGVWDLSMVEKMANALSRLGTVRSWIVHGKGLDELTLSGTTIVAEVIGERVCTSETSPEDFGLEPCDLETIRCADPVQSAMTIRKLLEGSFDKDSPAERLVLLNAAAALFLSGVADDRKGCVNLARHSIRSGAAREKLNELAESSKE